MDNPLIWFVIGFVILIIIAIVVTRALVKSRLTAQYHAEAVRLEKDLEHLQSDKEELETELTAVRERIPDQIAQAVAQAEKAKDAVIEAREQAHADAMATLKENFTATMEQMKAQVKADTDALLKQRQQEFKESGTEAIGHLLEPFKTRLEDLRKEMSDNSDQHKTSREAIKTDVDNLMKFTAKVSTSAEHLAAAFKYGNKIQGTWGETILEELLSSQGLTKGIHFDVQPTISGADSTLRPDVIIHLDRRREVIVDAKVSLSAYVNYVNAATEEDRQRYLKAHIDSIKTHVKELVKKDYASYIKPPKVSAGYVIMFVPNMGALWAALNAEPDLWRRAAEQNVYIADEQSLYGAIRIVQLTWTQVQQAENHEKVFELADEMIGRVDRFLESYESIGKAINSLGKAYEEGHKKLEPGGQSIKTTAVKLVKMGARKGKFIDSTMLDIDQIPQLEEQDNPLNP
ncbi:MAG: DNA recombination protein RmuC [Bacteroidales bacterium]|nr:DNA recombination protein RmuC [Bacteroidales bacterium]